MKRKILSVIIVLMVAPLLAGCPCFACRDPMSVQQDYVAIRDECQDASELRIDSYDAYLRSRQKEPFEAYMTPRQKSREMARQAQEKKAMLFTMFKDCMTANDWLLSRPKDSHSPKDDSGNIIDTARKKVNSPEREAKNPVEPPPSQKTTTVGF